jgi:uncharacterized phiE125 gp8 family phage protein
MRKLQNSVDLDPGGLVMTEMSIQCVAPATTQLVSLAETKIHLKQEEDADDSLISSLIKAATKKAQNVTKRQFLEATFESRLDRFPVCFEFPRPPLLSVVSIKYIDTDGNEQTFDSSKYSVDTFRTIGRAVLKSGESWPSVDDDINVVRVQWKAGYGTKQSDVPEDIRAAILLTVGHLYEHREDVIVGASVNELPQGALDLLWSYRIVNFS